MDVTAGEIGAALPRPRQEFAAQVAARARAVVTAELERRGARVREVLLGRRRELRVRPPGAAEVEVRVVSRRSGDWQFSIRGADASGRSDRWWVFVDLAARPEFFVVPDSEVVAGVRRRYRAHLLQRDLRHDAALNHVVRTRDVSRWAHRWALLELDGADPGRTGGFAPTP